MASIVVPNTLCIPRIESSIPKSQIFNTFCRLKVGIIESVVEIPFKDMPRYKRIIVKLKWNDSDRAKYMLARFREDKNVKIVYNSPEPWFWICVPNRLHCKIEHPRESIKMEIASALSIPQSQTQIISDNGI